MVFNVSLTNLPIMMVFPPSYKCIVQVVNVKGALQWNRMDSVNVKFIHVHVL